MRIIVLNVKFSATFFSISGIAEYVQVAFSHGNSCYERKRVLSH